MGVTTAVGQAMAEMQGTSNGAAASRFFEDGAEIGDWQILALVGKGGNGEVYRVRHARTGAIAALKAFYGNDPHQSSRFELEAEILQKMASSGSSGASHFPRYLDSGVIADCNIPYVVTEFLCEFVLPTQDADVAKLVLEVCEAIQGLHQNGYLHRDVKPENLMCRENGEIVLIDFGLAARITDISNPLHDRTSRVGTDGSTAPEQMHGHASVRSDVYALGSLANDCFRGKPPAKWIPIVQKALSPKEEFRYRDIDALAAAVKKRTRPSKRVLIGIAALVCVLIGLAVAIAIFASGAAYDDARNPKIRAQYEAKARADIKASMEKFKAHSEKIKADMERLKANVEAQK